MSEDVSTWGRYDCMVSVHYGFPDLTTTGSQLKRPCWKESLAHMLSLIIMSDIKFTCAELNRLISWINELLLNNFEPSLAENRLSLNLSPLKALLVLSRVLLISWLFKEIIYCMQEIIYAAWDYQIYFILVTLLKTSLYCSLWLSNVITSGNQLKTPCWKEILICLTILWWAISSLLLEN